MKSLKVFQWVSSQSRKEQWFHLCPCDQKCQVYWSHLLWKEVLQLNRFMLQNSFFSSLPSFYIRVLRHRQLMHCCLPKLVLFPLFAVNYLIAISYFDPQGNGSTLSQGKTVFWLKLQVRFREPVNWCVLVFNELKASESCCEIHGEIKIGEVSSVTNLYNPDLKQDNQQPVSVWCWWVHTDRLFLNCQFLVHANTSYFPSRNAWIQLHFHAHTISVNSILSIRLLHFLSLPTCYLGNKIRNAWKCNQPNLWGRTFCRNLDIFV